MKIIKLAILFSAVHMVSGCQTAPKVDEWFFFDGQVSSENGVAVVDADATLHGKTTKTNSNGCFLFRKSMPGDRLRLSIAKDGFQGVEQEVPYGNYRAMVFLRENNQAGKSLIHIEPITRERALQEPCIPENGP